MAISRSINIVATGIISSFLIDYYSIKYMYYIFFIHSSVDGHLGYFCVLAMVKSTAMKSWVDVAFWII